MRMVSSPVFVHLLHGRDTPDEEMSGWGFVGPILGPFEAVHFTYKEHVRCIADANSGAELELRFHDDVLIYEGKYYGDFEICGGQCLDYKNLIPEFFASLDLITGLAKSIVRNSQDIRAKWPIKPVNSVSYDISANQKGGGQ